MSKHTRTRLPEGTTQVRNASTGEVKQVGGIRMSEVFDLPIHVDITGVIFDNDSCAIGEICGTLKQSESVGHAINNHDKLTDRAAELEAALNEALEISERSNEQNPSNFDQELAMEHNEDICEIYHLLKALKEGE